MSQHGSCDPDTAERVIMNSRQECSDASAAEVVQMISEKGRSITRSTKNPIGLLVSIIPKGFRGYRRPEAIPLASLPVEPVCKLCGDSGWIGEQVGDWQPCTCDKGARERSEE
jgi:hypothetical protein